MYANAINAVTYEGDNYVIAQQVPRAVLKHWREGTEGSIPSLSYLSALRKPPSTDADADALPMKTEADWLDQKSQRWVLEHRLAQLVREHIEDTEKGRDTSFAAHALAMAHGDFVYLTGLWDVISQPESAPFREPLTAVAHVFGLSIVVHAHKDLLPPYALSAEQRKALRAASETALALFAEKWVGYFIESYGFTEYEMDSALARAEETPYEALLNGARGSEMSGAGMQHLWPMMVDTRELWKRVGKTGASSSSRGAKL